MSKVDKVLLKLYLYGGDLVLTGDNRIRIGRKQIITGKVVNMYREPAAMAA